MMDSGEGVSVVGIRSLDLFPRCVGSIVNCSQVGAPVDVVCLELSLFRRNDLLKLIKL